MMWYNNPDAVQAVHDEIVRQNHDASQRRRLLRVVSSPSSEGTPTI